MISNVDSFSRSILWSDGRGRRFFNGVTLATLLMTTGWLYGCGKAPPPVTDPAKAPWLLDPQSQIKSLKEKDYRIRGIAAFNLGNMGAKAADAIPELERIAQSDPEQKVREKAQEALGKIRNAAGSPNK
jgi:hypothetical protein